MNEVINVTIFFKQVNLLDPKKIPKNMKIHIYGLGSIGSHVFNGLLKTGFRNLHIYDFDKVEASNIPAQVYNLHHVDLSKTQACLEIARKIIPSSEQHDFSVFATDTVIKEDFKPDVSLESIHILAFDNMEARKIVMEKLKGFHVMIIDGRIGGFNLEIYSGMMDDKKFLESYSKSYEGEFSEQECGSKCLWSVNSIIAGYMLADIISYVNNEQILYGKQTNIMGNQFMFSENSWRP